VRGQIRVGYLDPVEAVMTSDNLALFARALRPTGKILLREPMTVSGSPLATRLTLAGFVNIEASLVNGLNQVCMKSP